MVALILEFECDTRGALDEHTLLDYYTLWLIDWFRRVIMHWFCFISQQGDLADRQGQVWRTLSGICNFCVLLSDIATPVLTF